MGIDACPKWNSIQITMIIWMGGGVRCGEGYNICGYV
jgi:hypothetical protein